MVERGERDGLQGVAAGGAGSPEPDARPSAEALEVAARRYRALLRAMSQLCWSAASDGSIVEPSPDWEAFTGQPFAEYRGWGWTAAVHPEDRARAEEAWRDAVAARGILDVEYRLRRADGVHRWMRARAAPVLDDEGRLLEWVGLLADVHEQHTAAAALARRTAQLAALAAVVDWADVAILTKDLDARILTWNRSAERLTGFTADEVRGRSVYDVIVPEHHPREHAVMERILRGEATQEVELGIVTKSGGRITVICTMSPLRDESGAVIGSSAIARDVTEQRRVEEELRGKHQLLASLFEGAPVAIALYDAALRFVRVNPVLAAIDGLAPEAYVGRTLADVRPALAERVHPILRHVLCTGEPVRNVELVMPGPDRGIATPARPGREGAHYLATYFPIHGAEGTVHGVGGMLVDITEHAELQDRLRQAQKMEAIGQLAGGVAHDFNNILAAILMNCEFLSEVVPADGAGRQELEDLCTAAQRAANLTRQLLTFSRKQVLAPQVLDLNEAIREVEGLLRRLLGAGIHMELGLDPEPVCVRADPSQVTQVLMNLVVNARDAMPEGGTLTLRTSTVPAERAEPPGPRDEAIEKYALLEVDDTGSGMPPEVRAHLFEPFYSTKAQGKGTGLGLATVHNIVVEQAGGFIRVDTAPGRGTRFQLYLPRQRPTADVADRRLAPMRGMPRGDETVLLVEDEPEIRNSVRRLLERLGYTVLTAENGAEALVLVERAGGGRGGRDGRRVDLLLTDVVMPEMGGRELALQVRRRHPGTGVLFMSGYSEEAIRLDELPGGRVAFLEKPFTLDALARQVRAVLDQPAQATAEPAPDRPAGAGASASAGAPRRVVLVVDDDAGPRRYARVVLEEAGYAVVEAASAEAALALITVARQAVDLLVTDLRMGGMSGGALVAAVRALLPELPVLCVGGYPEAAARADGVLPSSVPYLMKPYPPDALLGRVAELLGATVESGRG
jgi:two-component system, cell cycle sensor histidine kinase and response regulator CckA